MKGRTTASRRKKKHAAKVIPHRAIRQLNAEMALKCLSLREVSRRSGVNYYVASAILNGRRTSHELIESIRDAITRAPILA